MKDKSPGWIKQQLLTLGSTAAGVVAGESPYASPAELYDKMVAAAEDRLIPDDMNDDMRRGILTEPLHRQLLEDHLGKVIHDHDQDTFLHHLDMPWAHALPDGWLIDDGREIPVQLKCPRPRSWHEIKLKGLHGYWLLGTQHSLAVTAAPYEQFSVLNPETFRVLTFPVYPDPEIIAELMRIERDFYAGFLERRRPIEAETPKIELPSIKGTLKYLAGPEAMEARDFYRTAMTLQEDAEALVEEAKARIAQMMGEAEVVEFPGLRVYWRDMPGRKTLDRSAMKNDGIDPAKYEKSGKPYKMFSPYWLGK